jgi:hypothetical protein
VAAAELKKLRRMSEQQPGYSSLREYLEWIADLPWAKESSAPPIADDAEAATVVTLSGGAFPTPPSTYLGLESRSSRRFSQLTSSKAPLPRGWCCGALRGGTGCGTCDIRP